MATPRKNVPRKSFVDDPELEELMPDDAEALDENEDVDKVDVDREDEDDSPYK